MTATLYPPPLTDPPKLKGDSPCFPADLPDNPTPSPMVLKAVSALGIGPVDPLDGGPRPTGGLGPRSHVNLGCSQECGPGRRSARRLRFGGFVARCLPARRRQRFEAAHGINFLSRSAGE